MAVSTTDESAKEPVTKTARYGTGFGPDVGSIPAAKPNSPSIHELAVQTVNERGGANAAQQPTYKAQIEQVEKEMRSHLDNTLES